MLMLLMWNERNSVVNAARNSDFEGVKRSVDEGGDSTQPDYDGMTALLYVAKFGLTSMIE